MLTTRLFPPEEWDRLDEIEPYRSKGLPGGDPANWRILAVERDGQLVGTCAFYTAVHWDNWWIEPEARGKGGVLHALLEASYQLLKVGGVETVYTGAEAGDQAAQQLLVHFGFWPTPGKLFVLNVEGLLEKVKKGA